MKYTGKIPYGINQTGTGSIAVSVENVDVASFTSGSLDVSGSLIATTFTASTALINGDVRIKGTASVDVLITSYESSSIIYSSGSTKFGDTLDDTHQFTGSVYITSSLDVTGGITGSLFGTASYVPTLDQVTTAGNTTTNAITVGGLTVDTNTLFVDATNNRVGIGTLSPAVKLTVQQSTSAYSQLETTNFDMALGIAANTNKISGLDFKNFDSTGQVRFMSRNNVDDYIALNSYGSSAGGTLFGISRNNIHALFGQGVNDTSKKLVIGTFNLGDLIFGTNNTERIRVFASTGNLSIGTIVDAGYKLDVNGSTRVKGSGTTSATTALLVENANASGSMVVLDNGNVGIGTSSPSNKLDVIGNIEFGAVNVSDTWRPVLGVSNLVYPQPFLAVANADPSMARFNIALKTDTIPDATNTVTGFTGPQINLWNSGVSKFLAINTNGLQVSNGTSLLLQPNSGNVGIGTTTPAYTLDVSGSGNFTDNLTVTGSLIVSGSSTLTNIGPAVFSGSLTVADEQSLVPVNIIRNDNNNTLPIKVTNNNAGGKAGITFSLPNNNNQLYSIGVDNDRFFKIGEGNLVSNTRFVISPIGNIGIGTTSPSSRLQVKGSGTTNATTAFRVENANASGSMVVLDDGNVGIGTTTPTYKLDITGTARITSGLTSTGTNYLGLNYLASNANINSTGDPNIHKLSNDLIINAGASPQSIYMYTNNSPILSIKNDGNIGIGITTPSYKLDVSGSGNFTNNLTVTGSLTVSGSSTLTNIGPANFTGSVGITGETSIYKSGSTVLDIQGSQGQLFSVVDELSGSLMSVNDISGLPILEVFSDDRVVMGTYGSPGLIVTGSTIIATGSLFGTASYVPTLDEVTTAGNTTANDINISRTFSSGTSNTLFSAFYTHPDYQNGGISLGQGYNETRIYLNNHTSTSTIGQVDRTLNITTQNVGTINISARYHRYDTFLTGNYIWYDLSVEKMRLEGSTGNLLIGTTTDGARLRVKGSGTTSATTAFLVENANASGSIVVLDDGNVGIGTDTPTQKLTVIGNISSGNSGIVYTNRLYAGDGASGVNLDNANNMDFFSKGNFTFRQGDSTAIRTSLYEFSSTNQGFTGTDLEQTYFQINPKISQSATAAYKALAINVTETSTGDGSVSDGNDLLWLGVGGSNKFKVTSTGGVRIDDGLTVTGSLTVSGSSTLTNIGPAIFSGSLIVTEGITGSLFGTSSYALTASYLEGYVDPFPYTGSAEITGSLGVTGSLIVSGSDIFIQNNQFYSSYNATGTAVGLLRLTPSNNTQLRAQSGNNIAFETDGQNTMWIGNDQRVGIGTISPSAKLQVKGSGTTSATTAFRVENANASSSMVVLDDGKVGIGTTSPATPLDVTGAGRFSGFVRSNFLNTYDNTKSIIGAPSNYVSIYNGSGAEAVRINSTGNVGIGTTTPSYKLDVSGSGNFTDGLTVTGSLNLTGALTASSAIISGDVIIQGTASVNTLIVNQTQLSTGSNQLGDAADDFQTLYGTVRIPTGSLTVTGSTIISSSNATQLQVGDNSLFVSGSGNVGIGTTSPSEKLHVYGSGALIQSPSYSNAGFTVSDDIYDYRIGTTPPQVRTNYIHIQRNGSNTRFAHSGGAFIWTTGATEVARISAAGNVGIGTTTPTAQLQVKGSGTTSSTTAFRVENANASNSLVVLDNGQVGIGVTNPTGSLTTNGNIQINNNGGLTFYNANSIFSSHYITTSNEVLTATSNNTYGAWKFNGYNVSIAKNLAIGTTLTDHTAPSQTFLVSGSTVLRGNTAITGSTTITGSLAISGSTGTSPALTIYKSGSTVFQVQGSQGELFAITDSLSGSLFSVSNISGLPIMEVFSDNTTLMGDYLAPALITTKRLTVNSGSTVIYSIPTASYDGAFFEYTIKSGSNARAGQIFSTYLDTTASYTDNSTSDIGDTTGFIFGVILSGSNMVLTGSASTDAWTVKTIIRSI